MTNMKANSIDEKSDILLLGGWHRAFIYSIGLLECLLFGGNIFGWAQLVYLLKSEGVYFDLCAGNDLNTTSFRHSNSTQEGASDVIKESVFKGCFQQDERFALLFILAFLCHNSYSFVAGYLLHKWGLAVSRIIAGCLLFTGFLCIGLTSIDYPHWVFVGVVTLSMGNSQIKLANTLLAELLPNMRATAMTTISGAYAFSSGIFVFMQFAVEGGINRKYVFWFISGLAGLILPMTYFIPSRKIEEFLKQKEGSKPQRLRDSLASFSFLASIYYFVSQGLLSALYPMLFNSWISNIVKTDIEASFLSKLLSLSALALPFIIFLPGVVTDYFAKDIPKDCATNERKVLEIRSHFVTTMLVAVSAIALTVCLYFHTTTAVYFSIAFIAFLRPSMFGTVLHFFSIRFPATHFTRIAGMMVAFCTPGILINYGIFILQDNSPNLAMSIVLIIQLLTLVHPLHFLFPKYLKRVLDQTFQ